MKKKRNLLFGGNKKLCQNQESLTVNLIKEFSYTKISTSLEKTVKSNESNIEDILGLSISITTNSNTSHAHE